MQLIDPHTGLRRACLKGGAERAIGRSRGGLTSKLHAACDQDGRPVALHLTAGQVHDVRGLRELPPALPQTPALIADRACDADWLKQWLNRHGTKACILSTAARKAPP